MEKSAKRKENNFLLQGGVLAAAGIISRLIGLAYRIPLTNIITMRGQGIYGIAFQIYSIALLLTSYSLPLAVSKLVSQRVAKGETTNAYRVLKSAMAFAFTVGGGIAIIVFFAAQGIATNIMSQSLSTYAVKVLAPGLFFVAIMGVLRGYFQGLGTMIPTAVTQILEQVVNAIVSIVGAKLLFDIGKTAAKEQGDEGLAYAYAAAGSTLGTVIGALCGLLFLVLLFFAYKKRLKRQLRRDKSTHRESYRFIIKIMLLTIAPVLLSTVLYNLQNVVDNAMFNRIMFIQGIAEKEYAIDSGRLDTYLTMVSIPLAIANALAASFIPTIVSAAQTQRKRYIHEKIQTLIRVTMLIMIPCSVGYIVLARPILDMLYFSSNNEILAIMLRIGAISIVFDGLSTVTNAVLQGLNRMMKPVKNAMIALIIHVVSLFIMLVFFKWGIYAVIISKIVFSIVMCILNAHDIREEIGYVQEQRKTLLIPSVAAGIMGVVTFVIYFVLDIFCPHIVATLLSLLIAVITYALSILLLGGVSEEELLLMPRGARMIKLLRKLRLLNEEFH